MRQLSLIIGVLLIVIVQATTALAADSDGDLIDDTIDLCPDVADPYQGDHDGDGVGDLCDPDAADSPTSGDDLLVGTSDADDLDALGGDDHLYGLAGDDSLVGNDGDDFLDGGPGDDTLTGGPGCDVFALDPASSDADTLTDFSPGEDRFAIAPLDADPTDDLLDFTVSPSDLGIVVAFSVDDTETLTVGLVGVDGLDAVDVAPCTVPPPPIPDPCDFYVTFLTVPDGFVGPFSGTAASEHISGTAAAEDILGEGGDDCVYGNGGNDDLYGDGVADIAMGGNDALFGGDESDALYGDAFDGSVSTGGADRLYGGGGDDSLFGEAYSAQLRL